MVANICLPDNIELVDVFISSFVNCFYFNRHGKPAGNKDSNDKPGEKFEKGLIKR